MKDNDRIKEDKEQAHSSDMRVPNQKTTKTIENSEKGVDVHTATSMSDLFKRLGFFTGKS